MMKTLLNSDHHGDSEVYTENDDENDDDDSHDDDDDDIQNEWFSPTAMLGVTNAIAPTLGNITRKNWRNIFYCNLDISPGKTRRNICYFQP